MDLAGCTGDGISLVAGVELNYLLRFMYSSNWLVYLDLSISTRNWIAFITRNESRAH